MDECQFTAPPPGTYPYKFVDDERFQYRVKIQPAGESLEFVVRCADVRRVAEAENRAFHGIGRGVRLHPADDVDREDSLRRSVERSKRMVRLLAIQIRADRLITFTTRETYDRPTLTVIWDRFHRLVRRVCGGFAYVAVPEPHPTNPDHLHIHAATHGWINVNLLRKCWQAAIVSVDGRARARAGATAAGMAGSGSPGNVDIQYRGKALGLAKTRRIATYIGKYITKEVLPLYNKKRYWITKGVKVPDCQRKWLKADNLKDAVLEIMRDWGLLVGGDIPALKVWMPGNLAFFWVGVDALPEPPF